MDALTAVTPAARAKQLGTTTQAAANAFGCSRQNLDLKFRNKPNQFDIICLGAAAVANTEGANVIAAGEDYLFYGEHKGERIAFNPPAVMNAEKVGSYPPLVSSGGGLLWDEVLEYRVWVSPKRGAPDLYDGMPYFFALATYQQALEFAAKKRGSSAPVALVLQREYINNALEIVKEERLTEWPIVALGTSCRRNVDVTAEEALKKYLEDEIKFNQAVVYETIFGSVKVTYHAALSETEPLKHPAGTHNMINADLYEVSEGVPFSNEPCYTAALIRNGEVIQWESAISREGALKCLLVELVTDHAYSFHAR